MIIFVKEISRITDLVEVLRKEVYGLNTSALKMDREQAEAHFDRAKSTMHELNKEMRDLQRHADEYKRERGE